MSQSFERARSFVAYLNKMVEITLGTNDHLPDQTEVIIGRVIAIATRKKGNADWRGPQYDLVVRTPANSRCWTMAISRIRSIEVID